MKNTSKNTSTYIKHTNDSERMRCRIKLNIYAFLTVFIWATAFPVTRMLSDQFSAYSLGFIRCSTASLLLLAIGIVTKLKKPASFRDALLLLIGGILGFGLYLVFFNTGIATLTSATSSVIIAITPVMTAAAASFIYREKLNIIGWLSIAAAFSGVCLLMFWNGILSLNTGILWTLAAATVFCAYNLMNRHLSASGYSAMEIVTFGMIGGALILLPFAPQAISEIAAADTVSLLLSIYLGLMPSAISYILWAKAMSLADKTSEVTNYMFVTPLLSTIMGFIMLGEHPDMGTYIGGIIIIISVIVFTLRGNDGKR